jgi:transcriptional regulator of heat shock response
VILGGLQGRIMNERQGKILDFLVREYINKAEPVGSGFLAEKEELGVSSATIRNDLAELEEQGLVSQPHTSAGRIPTEKGYKYFTDNFLKDFALQAETDEIQKIEGDGEEKIKNIAKSIAKISTDAVFVAFGKGNVYYTGISNLFKKPEFEDKNIVVNVSLVIDALDEKISKIYENNLEEPKIFLGEESPFGAGCAATVIRKEKMMFGIMGLSRMDYEKNLALIKFIKEII